MESRNFFIIVMIPYWRWFLWTQLISSFSNIRTEYIELTSHDTYQQLSQFCIGAQGRTFIEFSVNSSTDVHFTLMTNDLSAPRANYSQIYEIVIGGWSNKESCIRAQRESCKTISTPDILNDSELVDLWVSWDQGQVNVGTGRKSTGGVVFNGTLSDSYEVNYFAVMTHFESVWRFLDDTGCEKEEFNNTYIITEDLSCNGMTTYRCKDQFYLTAGNLTRTCRIGRQWEGVPPVCSACPCPCQSGDQKTTNMSTEHLQEKIAQFKKELVIHKNATNVYLRSKISAADHRLSSSSIGYTLGYGILVSLLCVIFIPDLLKAVNHILKKNRHHGSDRTP